MTGQYHDRFSKAIEELPEKNAFFCKTCDTKVNKKDVDLHEQHDLHVGERTMTELLQEGFGP